MATSTLITLIHDAYTEFRHVCYFDAGIIKHVVVTEETHMYTHNITIEYFTQFYGTRNYIQVGVLFLYAMYAHARQLPAYFAYCMH